MAYNLDAIKAKINQLSGANKGGGTGKNRAKINWFKPALGQHNIRFLPYSDQNGQPFQEVAYYDSKLLSDRRIVTPTQFGMEDPIMELYTELKKDRSKEAWQLWKNLQPKERYYALIIVRGEEEMGPQVWELNSKLVKDIYVILAHPDYKDENLMDVENGYDFTVTVSPTDKTFNGNPVKDIKLQARRKSSPLADSEASKEKILKNMPDLVAYFKAQVKSKEEMAQIIENFVAGNASMDSDSSSDASTSGEEPAKEASTSGSTATNSVVESAKSKKTKKNLEDAFDDL